MIAWLHGIVVDISTLNLVVLDVGGVGYAVEVTTPTYAILCSEKKPVSLHIQTIVREDAINLFGFLEQEEKALFKALIKVNGIGPKSAIGILSTISPSMLIQCIQMQDKTMLTKLPGVGKKTAERLLIEMQDILKNVLSIEMKVDSPSVYNEAISALEALGYKPIQARETIKKLQTDEVTDAQSLIKAALAILSKH